VIKPRWVVAFNAAAGFRVAGQYAARINLDLGTALAQACNPRPMPEIARFVGRGTDHRKAGVSLAEHGTQINRLHPALYSRLLEVGTNRLLPDRPGGARDPLTPSPAFSNAFAHDCAAAVGLPLSVVELFLPVTPARSNALSHDRCVAADAQPSGRELPRTPEAAIARSQPRCTVP